MSDRTKNFISIGCFLAAVIIACMAMWITPIGIIDSSVLWFTAQLLVLCSTIIGVNFNIADVFISKRNKD